MSTVRTPTRSTPRDGATRRRLRRGVGVLAVAVLLAACGSESGSGSTERATTTTTTRPAAGSTDLARGETPGIASQLTEVPGYVYEDPPASEVQQTLALMKSFATKLGDADFFSALSLHGVVADEAGQNTARTASGSYETGFLKLFEFSVTPPSDIDPQRIAALGMGTGAPSTTFTVAGTTVLVYEAPDTPDSRWTYTWYRHGVQGAFDGATREPTERWVRAYLAAPERQPAENDRLAAQLVPVSGYAYTNGWTDDMVSLAEDAFPADAPASAHAVADVDGRVGSLVLGEVPASTTPQQLADDVARSISEQVGAIESIAVSGVPVATTRVDAGTLFVWVRGGVAGAFATRDAATGTAFLGPYLATPVP